MAAAPRAGVIGLGIIGSRVAARLAAAGFPLSVWNRTPRELPGVPASASDPAAVAENSDIVQIFVADDAALRGTLEKTLPSIGPHHVLLCGKWPT
jgi:3-hydroxyisobutyrate dehydrogenase-like beta-hydroxyacid dehydrogenase